MKVKLTYFKSTGKFYSSDEFETVEHSLYLIWTQVKLALITGKLPGLVEGHASDYIVLVDVPEHPNNHPHLVI